MIWSKLHGAFTHGPLVLAIGSVIADAAARALRAAGVRWGPGSADPATAPELSRIARLANELTVLGRWSMILAGLATIPAALSGLMLTPGHPFGGATEALRYHHLFVWPAIALVLVLGSWRWRAEGRFPRAYTAASVASALLMTGAGYWGGEMLVGEPGAPRAGHLSPVAVTAGRKLYLQSCAHCHAADGSGDEGPDLRGLQVSDRYIARMIKYGEPHEMPSFAKKHNDADIAALTAYLRSLRS